MRQTGRSWVKVDGHSTKSRRSFWMNLGPFEKRQSGRLQSVKEDGTKVLSWTVQKCQSGRSKSVKPDRLKVIK